MTETKSSPEKEERTPPLVAYLLELFHNKDRGALAELRRGAGEWPNCGERVLRHVARFFPHDEAAWRTRSTEDAMLLVATLFALNPTDRDGGIDIGEAMRRTGKERDAEEACEARFLRLLGATEPVEIATHLRHAVELAAGKKIEIGWGRLLRDLENLLSGDEARRERVRRDWSRSFWSARYEDAGDGDSDS